MDAGSPRWTTVGDSPHDHEREALAFLRRRLYDRESYRVWSNFEFTAPGGNLYEVDALAITDNGVHLIEIKSHPGAMGGDGATWTWTTPEGQRKTLDNPRLLANRKAKALKEVLSRSKAFSKHRNDVPYVSEVVFLSDPDLVVTLSAPGRHQVFGRDVEDGETIPAARSSIGGIVAALTSLGSDATVRSRRRIDRPTGARIAEAVEQAGIRERSSRRQFGDYRIADLLVDVEADRDTGIAYQDFLVDHVSLTGLRRRLRLYPLERNATTDQREAASRAARREFSHLRPLEHPGILAPIDFFEHDRGPCLLFDHDPGAVPLDRWLLDTPVEVDALDRLNVVRQVAEALAHAHGNGVFHRALAPSAILVTGSARDLRVKVADWHAGARVGTGEVTGNLTGTDHIDALSAGDAALYRAPEHPQALAQPGPLDVFSLGCLACAVFTGSPPAPTPAKLRELLARAGSVSVDAVGDGVDVLLGAFVEELTDVDPARRPADLATVLEALDAIEEEWTLPDPADDEPSITMARRGSTVGDGRFEVYGRLGQGSTAFALLVRDLEEGRLGVLKVANEPRLADRLDAEAAALASLDHHGIVKLLEGPFDLDDHRVLLLSYAGRRDDADVDLEAGGPAGRSPRTLAARIGVALDAEVTERFGEDLLEAVRHLEEAGVAHRDIKPENLGVATRGQSTASHLVLFDFSLASAPIDRLDAGTPGYIDPFLARRKRWDTAAERYSAAVVLHELCTGAKPVYGDGRSDPGLVDAPLHLDPALFDASVADGLVGFFRKALDPDAEARHGTAADMVWAWREAFRAGRETAGTTDHPDDALTDPGAFEVPPGTTLASPLAGLALTARTVAALERLEILTVGDLLGEQLGRLRTHRGLGAVVRNELVSAVAHLREALTDIGELDDDAPLEVAARALTARTAAPATAGVLRSWLGLDGGATWPSVDNLVAGDVGRERVAEVLAGARERWIRQVTVRIVRDWIADELAVMGGVAAAEQLAERLARSRPAPDTELVALDGEHERAARAMVRAAIAVEGERLNARWVRRVVGGPVVVALDGTGGADGNRLVDHAAALAARTAELLTAGAETVVGRATLVAALRDLPFPDGARPLPDAALAELAASLCPAVAVNSRLELYRAGLPPLDALVAARRAFVAAERIKPEELAAKVAARFPAAQALPGRPELDELVAAAGLALRWDPVEVAYLAPVAAPTTGPSGTDLSRHGTSVPDASNVTPVEIDVAADFEARLRRSIDGGGLLVLVTGQKHLERCADELARLPVTTVDLDEWFVAELERMTETGRPSWELVVAADAAGPASASWTNLTKVVDQALVALTERLAATPGTVLLTRCGLLARYGRLDVVARWRSVVHDPASPLAALWLLVSSPGTTDVPMLDGAAIPVLTRNEWTRIPPDWLRNVHRAGSRA